jgi:hypothetical protein
MNLRYPRPFKVASAFFLTAAFGAMIYRLAVHRDEPIAPAIPLAMAEPKQSPTEKPILARPVEKVVETTAPIAPLPPQPPQPPPPIVDAKGLREPIAWDFTDEAALKAQRDSLRLEIRECLFSKKTQPERLELFAKDIAALSEWILKNKKRPAFLNIAPPTQKPDGSFYKPSMITIAGMNPDGLADPEQRAAYIAAIKKNGEAHRINNMRKAAKGWHFTLYELFKHTLDNLQERKLLTAAEAAEYLKLAGTPREKLPD